MAYNALSGEGSSYDKSSRESISKKEFIFRYALPSILTNKTLTQDDYSQVHLKDLRKTIDSSFEGHYYSKKYSSLRESEFIGPTKDKITYIGPQAYKEANLSSESRGLLTERIGRAKVQQLEFEGESFYRVNEFFDIRFYSEDKGIKSHLEHLSKVFLLKGTELNKESILKEESILNLFGIIKDNSKDIVKSVKSDPLGHIGAWLGGYNKKGVITTDIIIPTKGNVDIDESKIEKIKAAFPSILKEEDREGSDLDLYDFTLKTAASIGIVGAVEMKTNIISKGFNKVRDFLESKWSLNPQEEAIHFPYKFNPNESSEVRISFSINNANHSLVPVDFRPRLPELTYKLEVPVSSISNPLKSLTLTPDVSDTSSYLTVYNTATANLSSPNILSLPEQSKNRNQIINNEVLITPSNKSVYIGYETQQKLLPSARQRASNITESLSNSILLTRPGVDLPYKHLHSSQLIKPYISPHLDKLRGIEQHSLSKHIYATEFSTPKKLLSPDKQSFLGNNVQPLRSNSLTGYPGADFFYKNIQPHQLTKDYIAPYIQELRVIESHVLTKHDFANEFSRVKPNNQKLLSGGLYYDQTSLEQHKAALGFIPESRKALPSAIDRIKPSNVVEPLINSILIPPPSPDHFYRNIQTHQLSKFYINNSRELLLAPPKLKLSDVEVISDLDEVNKRQNVENRFRQSYLNEANRTGFTTVDVDILSSTYESKPYVSSNQQLIVESYTEELEQLKQQHLEPKIKVKSESSSLPETPKLKPKPSLTNKLNIDEDFWKGKSSSQIPKHSIINTPSSSPLLLPSAKLVPDEALPKSNTPVRPALDPSTLNPLPSPTLKTEPIPAALINKPLVKVADLGVRGIGLGMVLNSFTGAANASSGQEVAPYIMDATQTVGGLMMMAGGLKGKRLSIAGAGIAAVGSLFTNFSLKYEATDKQYFNDDYLGVWEFGPQVRGLLTEIKPGTLRGGFYQEPDAPYGSQYIELARRDTPTLIPPTKGKGELYEGRKRYKEKLEKAGLPVIETGDYHAKAFIANLMSGEEVGILLTGNLSTAALDSATPKNARLLKKSPIERLLGVEDRAFGYYQSNVGLIIRDKDRLNQLKGIFNELETHGQAASTKDFVVGGPGGNSRERIVEFIKEESKDKDSINVTAPFIDDPTIIKALVQAKLAGSDVKLITSKEGSGTKGYEMAILELQKHGIAVYRPKPHQEFLPHEKVLSIGEAYILGSHNFTSKASDRQIEISVIGRDSNIASLLKADFKRQIEEGFVSLLKPTSRSRAMLKADQLGIDERFSPLFLDSKDAGSLLLNPQMGASFFYSRALYNNLMRQAGYGNRTLSYKDTGIATSLYSQAYLIALNKKSYTTRYQDLEYTPFLVKQYDKELLTQGLGGLFNEFIAMPLGLGRLYKDEVGFIPSLLGTIGAVLDKTYLYTTGRQVPGVSVREDVIGIDDQRYKDKSGSVGLFETIFTEGAFLAQQAASSVAFYMIMGEPLNLLISEGLKTQMEVAINKTLDPDISIFNKRTSKVSRSYTLGLRSTYSLTPMSTRLNVISDIDTYKAVGGYFSPYNMDLSSYHLTNLFIRERAAKLQNEVMKPFILDYLNPYIKSDKESQDGFRGIIDDVIEEFRRPISLEYELISRSSTSLNLIMKDRALLMKSFSSLNTFDLSAEVISYKNLRHEVISIINTINPSYNLNNNSSLSDITKAIKKISNNQDEGIRSRFKEAIDSIDKSNTNLFSEYTSEGDLIRSVKFSISNVGQDRASIIAQRVQAVLDEIPLNPLRWGMFNKYKIVGMILNEWSPDKPYEGGYQRREIEGIVRPKVATIGDILSFSELTEITRNLLFGKGGISSFMAQYEVYSPSNDDNPALKRIALNASDKLESIWNMTVGFAGNAVKRVWDRYFLIMGTPFHNNGLLRSTDALKAMEYNLINAQGIIEGTRGISWADDTALVKAKVKEIREEALGLWNELYTLIDNDEEVKAVENLRSKGRNTEALEDLLVKGNREEFINHYISIYLPKEINPLARQLNTVDSSVVFAMQQIQAVDETIQAKGLGPRTHISIQEHLRSQMIGRFNVATLSGKQLAKRMIKIGGFDDGGAMKTKNRKSVFMNTIAWTLVTGSLFLESLFRNTSGVSLTTQLGLALTTGGGILSPLLGNKEGELNLSTDFAGTQLLPGSGPARYALGITLSAATLGLSHMVGVASLGESVIEYSIQSRLFKKILNKPQADGAFVDVLIKYKKSETEVAEVLLSELIDSTNGDWKNLNHIDIINRLKSSTLEIGENTYNLMSKSYIFGMNGNRLASIQAVVEGGQLVSKALTFRGNMWRNTAISYAILSLSGRAMVGTVANTLNFLRDNTGSIDSILFGGIGALLGFKKGGFSGAILGSFIGTSLSYVVNNVFDKRIFAIGSKGKRVENTKAQIVSELSNFRTRVIGNIDGSSRAELMGALWAGKIMSTATLLEPDKGDNTVKVQAKQIVLPFLQFYLVARTEGERTTRTGAISDPGQTSFHIGIQGPPITGMSMGISLPFKIIKGKGVFGLTANNDDYDVGDLMQDMAGIIVAAHIIGNTLKILDTGATVGRKTFHKVLGSTANAGSQVQRKTALGVVSRGFMELGNMVEDIGLILPNTVMRVGTSIPTVEYRLLKDIVSPQHNIPIDKPKSVRLVSYLPKLLMGSFIGAVVGQVGGAITGAILSPSDNYDIDKWSTMGIGVGLLLPPIYQIASLGLATLPLTTKVKTHLDKTLMKIRPSPIPRTVSKLIGKGKIFGAAFTLGYFLSSSGSGISIGMDADTSHQIGVASTYGLIMGTIATSIGGMGKGMSSTLETYNKITQDIDELNTLEGRNIDVFKRIRLTYQKFKVKSIKGDAEDVIAVLMNNKTEIDIRYDLSKGTTSEIKYKKLKDISDSIHGLDLGSAQEVLNSKTVKSLNVEDIKGSFLEGRFRNRVFAKRILRTLKVPILAAMIGGIANAFNPNINVDSFLNGLEGRLENQKRFRAGLGLSKDTLSLEQRLRDVAADTFKILFLKDRDVNSRVMLDKIMRSGDDFGGMNSQVSYSKLLNTNKSTLSDLGNIYNEMSQLFVLDDTNAFLTLGVAGGSFRRKEYGTIMTPYVQIQSSGADISSAAYSMSSSFLFKNMMYGPNDLLFNVQNAMRFLNTQTQQGRGNDRRVLRVTAIRLLSGTAHLNPRNKARRVSTISQGVLSAITKDALLGSILKHRVSINKNLSFQPYESLISILLKGQLNPSNPHLDRMMANKLKGIDKGLDTLFMGDPFFLITRNFNIVDIKAFAKGKGEKDKDVKSISQQYQDTDDIWTGMDSFYMTSYLPEDKSIFKDNPLVQLTNRLFSSLPGPIGFLGSISLLTLATFSIVSSLHSLNAKGETRILTKELEEYFNKDWFGRVGGKESHVYVWRTSPARPLPGEGVYLRGSPPLLFKGSYQFQLNANFYSKNVRYAFNQIQEDLNTLMFKGWGRPKTPTGNTPNIGTHVMDFLINQKEKHVQETLRTFDNLPQSFQDINESNNSFMFDRDKGIEHNLRELDKRLTDNTLDEGFRKRLEEERLKLSTELDNISGAKGKEILVKRIVEVYSNELDGFVDEYLKILTSKQIEVNNAYLAHMEEGGQLPGGKSKAKINAISLFATNATLEQLVEVSEQLDEDLDKGLKALVELMDDDHKKAFMVGDSPDIKLFLKSKARSQVEAAIKEYLKKLDNPQDIINFLSRLVKGDTLEITNMSVEVIGHLAGIKGDKKDSFFGRIRHHWGGLGKSPSSDNVRLLDKAIGSISSWMRNMSAPPGESTNPSMSSYTAHSFLIRHNRKGVNAEEVLRSVNDDTYIDKIAKAQSMLYERETFTSKTLKTGGLLWEIYGVANDILEAFNVFSAYGNLGQSYKNRNITEAQRLNYAYDAGMVTVNVGFSIGLMSLGVHVGMLGLSALTAGATSALLTVGLPLLAGAAVIGVGFLGYNLLPDKQKTQVKSAINNSYIATGSAIKKAGDFSFDLGTRIGGETLGGVLASGTMGAMGGTIAGATLGIAIGTFSLVSAAILGTSLISLGALGGMLLAGAAIGLGVGALLGITGGSNVIDGWMDKLSKVKVGSNQIFKPFINRPGDWLRMSNIKTPFRGRSQYGSPLETLTVNEAIQKDYSSMLYAATDETGVSSASLFISPTVYGSNVGETNAHMQKYGSISIIRPGGVADPLLIKDMSLRGQAFNQTIIGRYTWNKILSKASNLRGIKAAIERYKKGNIEHQKIEKTINQARSIKNNIGDIKAETPKRRGLSKEGVNIAVNILNIKDKYNEAQKAVNRKNTPLVAKIDMSNVKDYEREFRKDLNIAVRDVTLINKDNIIRVVPTIDADVKEAVLNPIST